MKPSVQVIHSVPSVPNSPLLPASEIINKIVRNFSGAYLGKTASIDEVRYGFQKYSFAVILNQFEKRSIPISYEWVREIIQELELDYDLVTKKVNVNVSNEFIEKLDRMLLTRKCSRCDLIIMNTVHGQSECDQILTQKVMES